MKAFAYCERRCILALRSTDGLPSLEVLVLGGEALRYKDTDI